jgi:hypothetical protein
MKLSNTSKASGSNPAGGEIFCARTDRRWGPRSLGYRVIPGDKAGGTWC